MKEINIVLSTGVFVLLLTLMAHDFHHDFMTLSGRVTSSIFSAVRGGSKTRKHQSGGDDVDEDGVDMLGPDGSIVEQAVVDEVDRDVNELMEGWTKKNKTHKFTNYDKSLTVFGDKQYKESIYPNHYSDFSLLIDELISSEILLPGPDGSRMKTDFYKTVESGIKAFNNIRTIANQKPRALVRVNVPLPSSGLRVESESHKLERTITPQRSTIQPHHFMGNKRKHAMDYGFDRFYPDGRNIKLRKVDPLHVPILQPVQPISLGGPMGSLLKKKKKKCGRRCIARKRMLTKLKKKSRRVFKKTVKKSKKIARKLKKSAKKNKKTSKKPKKSSSKKKKVIKGGARGYPISNKVAACRKILPDLIGPVGRPTTKTDGTFTIDPKTEINENIKQGWDEAYGLYSDILDSSGITMDQINQKLISLYKADGSKFRFMGNYPLKSLPDPPEEFVSGEYYDGLVAAHQTSGNPSLSHGPILCAPLCMLLPSDFFDGSGHQMIIRYEGSITSGKSYEMDFSWYFSEKMAQLSYAVKPSFKSGISSSEYMESVSDSLVDGVIEKYKMRGSNTFARFIELIQVPLQLAGFEIPLFKQPVLSPQQRKSVKALGREISISWHSFIYGKTCDTFLKQSNPRPEKEPIESILTCLRNSNSTDKKVDKFMTDYFNASAVGSHASIPIEFNDRDGSLDPIVSQFNTWLTSVNSGDTNASAVRKMVMDNAAPLGKSNWTSLYSTVERPVFLPSALDAAGSSVPETSLSDSDSEIKYRIKDKDNDGNEIILSYSSDDSNADMNLQIKLDDVTISTNWTGAISDLRAKPLSVKSVVKDLFTKLNELFPAGPDGSITDAMNSISIAISSVGGKYPFYYTNLLPVVMKKLSGDFGQEVCAAGGIDRGGKVYPITQAHNDIPAFLRGALISSKRDRSLLESSGIPQAPVIYQTAHNGRYLDARN